MKRLIDFLARHAWIFVVLAFAVLIAAWSAAIILAHKHPVQRIEVKK